MKTKKISDDLINLKGVCEYFGFSESTVRRKVRDTREGVGNFPLPLFGLKCRILFRRSDIENWNGVDAEATTFTPSMTLPSSQVLQCSTKVRKGLEALGVKLPSKTGGG